MIQLFAICITVACISGFGLIIEGATGAWSWFSAWVRTRPGRWASPHAKDGADEPDEHEDLFV